MCWLKKGCFKIHTTSVFTIQRWDWVRLRDFDEDQGGCVSFSLLLLRLREFQCLENTRKITRKKLNNQYIYYVIKNTGCNIARCSALILISLVSLSGTRSYGELQTKIFSAFFTFDFLFRAIAFVRKDWLHFRWQLPLGSGSVKSYCKSTSSATK